MSAIPSALRTDPLPRVSAAMVLESLRQRRAAQGRGDVNLGLGKDGTARARAEDDAMAALLLPGAVVELEALPGAGALTLALHLLGAMRARAVAEGKPSWLCAVDPSRTLHAPAVAALGVDLRHLVVLQPPADALARTAVRASRSGAFAGLLVDASGESDLGAIVTGVRRLTLAAEATQSLCVLVTSSRARRGLPLPVAARALVESVHGDLHVRFLRHRHGHMPRLVIPRRAA